MNLSYWQSASDEVGDDEALQTAVLEEYTKIYRTCFQGDPDMNHRLPVMIHAFRHLQEWRVFLLLTPWMLARVFVPDVDPGIAVPTEWRAADRKNQPYRVIGPAFDLDLLTGRQKAHLNFSPRIGHYMIHPLILSMLEFETPDQVFAAWNQVISTRNDNLERLGIPNPQQEEISRREFFLSVLR